MGFGGISRDDSLILMARTVRHRAIPIEIRRATTTTGSLDEQQETVSTRTEGVWLFNPRENEAPSRVGDRIDGQLGGLVVADGGVDIETGDELTHGSGDYEIREIIGLPNDTDPYLWQLSLTRNQ